MERSYKINSHKRGRLHMRIPEWLRQEIELSAQFAGETISEHARKVLENTFKKAGE